MAARLCLVVCYMEVALWRFPWHRDARGWGILAAGIRRWSGVIGVRSAMEACLDAENTRVG